jgi:hypothetical protein
MPCFDPSSRLPAKALDHDPLAMWIVRTALAASILALIVAALAVRGQ